MNKLFYAFTMGEWGSDIITAYNPTHERLSGYFYNKSALSRHAKKLGYEGIQKADTAFLQMVVTKMNERAIVNAIRRD